MPAVGSTKIPNSSTTHAGEVWGGLVGSQPGGAPTGAIEESPPPSAADIVPGGPASVSAAAGGVGAGSASLPNAPQATKQHAATCATNFILPIPNGTTRQTSAASDASLAGFSASPTPPSKKRSSKPRADPRGATSERDVGAREEVCGGGGSEREDADRAHDVTRQEERPCARRRRGRLLRATTHGAGLREAELDDAALPSRRVDRLIGDALRGTIDDAHLVDVRSTSTSDPAGCFTRSISIASSCAAQASLPVTTSRRPSAPRR